MSLHCRSRAAAQPTGKSRAKPGTLGCCQSPAPGVHCEDRAMPILADKVCVITGGSGSLGLASARLFLARRGEGDVGRSPRGGPGGGAAPARYRERRCGGRRRDRRGRNPNPISIAPSPSSARSTCCSATPATRAQSPPSRNIPRTCSTARWRSTSEARSSPASTACRDERRRQHHHHLERRRHARRHGGVIAYITAKHAQIGLMRCGCQGGGAAEDPRQLR